MVVTVFIQNTNVEPVTMSRKIKNKPNMLPTNPDPVAKWNISSPNIKVKR